MVKSPFNYLGNKYKYREVVQTLVGGKRYYAVIDPFLGSGNLLFNSGAISDEYIGIDSIRLLPNIYNYLRSRTKLFYTEDIRYIVHEWGNFRTKESYFDFREEWNRNYERDQYTSDFILKTLLLFKMCSNSVVRFNLRGEFNSGFRGAKPQGFFNSSTLDNMVEELNNLILHLKSKNYDFYNEDSTQVFSKLPQRGCLLLLDPPYILGSNNVYGKGQYDSESEVKLLELISSTENDFILFNLIERMESEHNLLLEISENFKTIELKTWSRTGQAQKRPMKISEVIVTNIT